MYTYQYFVIVYDLKFVGPLEFKLVAPMPAQLITTTMHFYEAPRKPYLKLPAEKLGDIFSPFIVILLENMNF